MSYDHWFAFLVACWLISLSPGAGAIASMSSGQSYGFKRGYWNAFGLQLGLILQIIIVAAGVGVLITTTPWAFVVIKWFGVGYLLYLAYSQWRVPVSVLTVNHAEVKQKSRWALVLNGFVVNASNPKAMVFMLAVLPQFIDISKPIGWQYFIMGLTMIIVDLIVMAGYTGLAAKILSVLKSPKQQKKLNQVFAILFACAATVLSLVHQ